MNIHNMKLAMRSLGDTTTIVGSFTVDSDVLGSEQSILQSELSMVANDEGIKLSISKRHNLLNTHCNSVIDGLTDCNWSKANQGKYNKQNVGGSILLVSSLLLLEENEGSVNRFVFSSRIRNHGNTAINSESKIFSGRLSDENENVIVFDLKETDHEQSKMFVGESYRGMLRMMPFESSKGTKFYIDNDATRSYRKMIEMSLEDIKKDGHVRKSNLEKLGVFNLKHYYTDLDFLNFSIQMLNSTPLYLQRSKRILTCEEHKEVDEVANKVWGIKFS